MIGLEMQRSTAKKDSTAQLELNAFERASSPTEVERGFACRLATSVWLAELDDDAARDALYAYAMARSRDPWAQACLRVALLTEYRLCRERLDLCS